MTGADLMTKAIIELPHYATEEKSISSITKNISRIEMDGRILHMYRNVYPYREFKDNIEESDVTSILKEKYYVYNEVNRNYIILPFTQILQYFITGRVYDIHNNLINIERHTLTQLKNLYTKLMKGE